MKPLTLGEKGQVIGMKKMRGLKKNNLGFSLVELIIVVAILAVLTAIIAPNMIKYYKRARKVRDMQGAQIIGETLERICAVDPQAAQEWMAVTNTGNHVEYTVTDYDGNTYTLTNVFEFTMTRKGDISSEAIQKWGDHTRGGQIRNARSDCKYLYTCMAEELSTNIDSMAYQEEDLRSFRCAKRLDTGDCEVWACYVPKGTDGEGVTNGYIQYQLWPNPDPRYLNGEYVAPFHAHR